MVALIGPQSTVVGNSGKDNFKCIEKSVVHVTAPATPASPPQSVQGAASDWDKAREVQSGKKRLEPDALSTFHFSPIVAREPVSPISRLHPSVQHHPRQPNSSRPARPGCCGRTGRAAGPQSRLVVRVAAIVVRCRCWVKTGGVNLVDDSVR
jgi:hypothetical protein